MRRRSKPFAALAAAAVVAAVLAVPAHTTGAGPLIVGNSVGFGDGPIRTFDFSTGGAPIASFIPDGVGSPPYGDNGRGVAILGNEVFYTELGYNFGPTDFIRVAPFNGGNGGSDTRTLPNPDPSNGVQDLAFADGALYAMTGYPYGGYPYTGLRVWKLDPSDGTVLAGPVTIAGGNPEADGFVVLPDGNFLINDGDAECHYNEYDPVTGAAIGSGFTLPMTYCTGVDTDGTYLYFETGFSGFTKTDLSGNVISTTGVLEFPPIEDIALAQPAGGITALSAVHAWIGLRNSDDQGTQFDLRVELYRGDTLVASGLTRCITGVTRNPSLAKEAVVDWDPSGPIPTSPGDVLSIKLLTRIGTTAAGAKCPGPGGSHSNAVGLRLYYDSADRQSHFDIDGVDEYLHSNGNACANAESTGVTTRSFNSAALVDGASKCKDSSSVNFAGGNPWKAIGTWSMTVP